MIQAKIIGATGYGGVGLVEWLLGHPEVTLQHLIAVADVGRRMDEVYPHLAGYCEQPIVAPDSPEAGEPADVVFFATPDRVAMQGARAELAQGAKVIDYSGDFRFGSVELYADYATRLGRDPEHADPALLPEAVYGLPELHRDDIVAARVVGNVGCFAVACILGLAPAVSRRLIRLNSLICDCKTGVSGAGKKPAPVFHFPARQDHMNAYRLTGHQHTCEIEQQLGRLAGTDVQVTFTAQVVPANRGILACLYADLEDGWTYDQVLDVYREAARGKPFLRVFDRHAAIGTHHVRGSNACYLTVDVDERTRRLRVVSHIDNLVKGQAGNAVQNLNLLFGFEETAGLDRPGQYP